MSILRLLSDKNQVGREKVWEPHNGVWYVVLKLAVSRDLRIEVHVKHRRADVLCAAEGNDGAKGFMKNKESSRGSQK